MPDQVINVSTPVFIVTEAKPINLTLAEGHAAWLVSRQGHIARIADVSGPIEILPMIEEGSDPADVFPHAIVSVPVEYTTEWCLEIQRIGTLNYINNQIEQRKVPLAH